MKKPNDAAGILFLAFFVLVVLLTQCDLVKDLLP